MNKLLIPALTLLLVATAAGQQLTVTQRLYYTCKAWGLAKYMHPAVTNCEVDWDSVLVAHLPAVREAQDDAAFNATLQSMLAAAGPVPIPTDPPPMVLPQELSKNLDTLWYHDDAISPDVRNRLSEIVTLFRMCGSCQVGGTGPDGWITFPEDDPILDIDMFADYPDEDHRQLLLFTYWNILRFFNPNSDILDVPWDSTFVRSVSAISSAEDMHAFHAAFLEVCSSLQDVHIDVLTWELTVAFGGQFLPKLILHHGEDGYIVVKSDSPPISVGDIILAVDGKAVSQWEDSLRGRTPVGSEALLKQAARVHMLRGDSATLASIIYEDSSGVTQQALAERQCSIINIPDWQRDYYPTDSLKDVKWQRLEDDIGYVHMGNLVQNDVNVMYAALSDTRAIIFDIRNYPQNTALAIAEKLLPSSRPFATLLKPDIRYPGTFYWDSNAAGLKSNPAPYEGKVIVLCNQRSISHAEWSCMILRTVPGCVLVGSQTAGADGNTCTIRLARDVQTGYTGMGVYYPDGTQTQRVGIVPDSVVYITAQAVREGRDLVLEKAMEIARQTATAVEARETAIPAEITLQQNYPNPFNPTTTITFSLPEAMDVTLSVVDLYGRVLRRLLDAETRGAGRHTEIFDAGDLASGVYLLRLSDGSRSLIRKMLLLR